MAVTLGAPGARDRSGVAEETATLLTQVARQATHALGTSGSVIFACDRTDRDALHAVAVEGSGELFADRTVSGINITTRALCRGRAVIAGAGRFPVAPDAVDEHGTQILAVAPIVDEGGAWGVVAVLDDRALELAENEVADILEDLAALTAAALRGAAHNETSEDSLQAGVDALSTLLDLRDGYTGYHADEVVTLCIAVGEYLGLDAAALRDLRIAGRLHDLGKIGIPDGVLHKPRELDDEEWSLVRQHPVWGAQALEAIPGFRRAARGVRGHHERWDGRGYPDGLQAGEIPLMSRIITVCDAFHAMVSDRPYRRALPTDEARRRLLNDAGQQFDPHVVDAVLAVIDSDRLPVETADNGIDPAATLL